MVQGFLTDFSPLPSSTMLPSFAQLNESPRAPICIVSTQPLLRTSQNLHVPSVEIEASSASFMGFHATRSTAPACPRSSVLFFTWGLSGFQMRRVRSWEPVAIRWPVGFHAMVRMLHSMS